MPSVKVSRDKRGYHYISLVTSSPGRLLYWFRSPSGVKVGREPFDAELRRALGARYPALAFDWQRLGEMRIPPPDEPWQERRRADRATRARAPKETSAVADLQDAHDSDRAELEQAPGQAVASEAAGRDVVADVAAEEVPILVGPATPDPQRAMEGAASGGVRAVSAGPRRRSRRRGRRPPSSNPGG